MVDEKKRDSSEASTVSFISRKKRKEDGKLRKRQSIEESGGIRPRNPHEISAGTRNQNDNADVQGDDRMQQHSKTSTSSSNAYPEQSQPKAFSSKSSPARGLNDNRGKKFDRNTEGGSGIRRHRFGRVMDIVPCRNKPRFSTISIAIPGSVVANCQTRELKTQICGQIARAATIYHVDEIIVYDDNLSSSINKSSGYGNRRRNGSSDGKNVDRNTNVDTPDDGDNKPIKDDTNDNISISRERASSDPHSFMARVLQYCECPQYLRRNFFPMHPDLQFAGLLPPIDPPHHVRAEDHCKYREGVVLEDKYVAKMENSKNKDSLVGRLVNCGIRGRPVL